MPRPQYDTAGSIGPGKDGKDENRGSQTRKGGIDPPSGCTLKTEAMMATLGRIEPQPPPGIKYMLGGESWLPSEQRSPIRLHCEEWGNMGPMELNPEIKPNEVGFRVRTTTIDAPPGARGFEQIEGVYYWSDRSWAD